MSKSGKVSLNVPKDADKVITNTKKEVKYVVNDGVILDNTSAGHNLTAPVTVEIEVTSTAKGTIKGETTYTADFGEAEVTKKGENLKASSFGNLLGTKTFAASQNQSKSDKTYSVKFRLNINWTVSNGYAGLTKVTGGYSQQVDDKSEGGNLSWSITRNYKPVKIPSASAMVGATYFATLKRGNSTWTFETTNRAY
ncbi:hypothetical protein [Lactococcus cremoris]|uniref:hypothetical protein n=1 Tax=Lactococcus lactis subsp. cremoris TaxID=1359 RepID=UPI00300E1991